MIPEPLHSILDSARWAPSGDNTQPWQFEVVDDLNFIIHAHDTRDWCVYDRDGHASELSIGTLLETLTLAAQPFGLQPRFELQDHTDAQRFAIRVSLMPYAGPRERALINAIPTRSVQRLPMPQTALRDEHLAALHASMPQGYSLQIKSSLSERWQVARMLFASGLIRYRCPEAYPVHRDIIEWDATFSEDRIPEHALGADPMTRMLMRWAMKSWKRVDWMNRYVGGAITPALQFDLATGLRCAAHVLIVAPSTPAGTLDWIAAGRAVQRLWLTCEAEGLRLQPEMTPLIFARFMREQQMFTQVEKLRDEARNIQQQLDTIWGADIAPRGVFMCRIGYAQAATSRSIRRPLRHLLHGR